MKKVAKHTKNETFTVENIKKKSAAAASICRFVLAVEQFHRAKMSERTQSANNAPLQQA